MRRLDEAMADLVESRQAEGPDHLIDTLRQRLAGEAEVVAVPGRTDLDTTRTRSRWRGPLIATGALAAALLIAFPVLWLGGSDETTGVGEPPAATTTAAPTPTSVPVVVGGAALLESAPLQFGADVGFARSGDTLWVWDDDGRVGSYRDGAWRSYPPLPGPVLDVAGIPDGSVWVVIADHQGTSSSLWYFEDDAWQWLRPELGELILIDDPPPGFHRGEDGDWGQRLSFEPFGIEADAGTGIVWVASGDHLYRWDGETLTNVGNPPNQPAIDIAVTGHGTVWAAGFNLFAPRDYGLARYHDDTGTWEMVRPLGGDKDVPVASLAPTPNGNLWVLLTDFGFISTGSSVSVGPPVTWALAHLDSGTGEWTIYQGDLPVALPGEIVADDEAVWLVHGDDPWLGGSRGVGRFDRQTWTTYLGDRSIEALGIGNDGTVWVSWEGALAGAHRLVLDQEPTG